MSSPRRRCAVSTFDSMSSVNRSPRPFYEAPQQDTSLEMWLDVHCACPVVGGSPVDCIGPGNCHHGGPVHVGDVCVDGEELLHLSPLLAVCRKMLTAASVLELHLERRCVFFSIPHDSPKCRVGGVLVFHLVHKLLLCSAMLVEVRRAGAPIVAAPAHYSPRA